MKMLYAFLFIALIMSCSKSPTALNNSTGNVSNSQEAKTEDKRLEELQKQIEQIASAAKGRVGVAAVVLAEQMAVGSRQIAESPNSDSPIVSLNLHGHFPMQSVYKLPIGMAVMQQVDAGKISLEQRVRVTTADFIGRAAHSPIRDKYPKGIELSVSELMAWMLGESDGTASDVLMSLAGGPKAIQAYLTELKITDMIVIDTEKAFAQDHSLQFRNWATPEAAVTLLRALHERRGLSEQSQVLLLKLMAESRPGAKRLKGLLPAVTIVAHKTGTSGTENGITAATNDIGIVKLPNGNHLAIAVFVADSPADQDTREAVIARIAKAVWDKWSLR